MNFEEYNSKVREIVMEKSSVANIRKDQINILWNANALDIRRFVAYDGAKFYLLTFEAGELKNISIYSKEQ